MISLAWINTQEWLRLKFFHVVVFLASIYLFVCYLLGSLSFVEEQRLIFDFGLAGIEIASFFLAFLSTQALNRDIERRTIQVILARPLARWNVLFGYLASIMLLNLIVITVLGLILFFFLRDGALAFSLVVSLFVIFLKSIVIGSFGLLCALVARPILSFTLTLAYWGTSYSIPDLKFFASRMRSDELRILSEFFDYIFPQFYRFNWKTFYFVRSPLIPEDIGFAVVHSVSWTLFLFILAAILFRGKELV
jgi:Cu-processing system permease protein